MWFHLGKNKMAISPHFKKKDVPPGDENKCDSFTLQQKNVLPGNEKHCGSFAFKQKEVAPGDEKTAIASHLKNMVLLGMKTHGDIFPLQQSKTEVPPGDKNKCR